MKSLTFLDQDCVVLENDILQLLVSRSVGPRILSLRFHKGRNLLAELPEFSVKRPDEKIYHFFGGHRLWLSPEDPIGSYALDDQPVEIEARAAGVVIRKPVEPETGIEKEIQVELAPGAARLTLTHRLTNRGPSLREASAWAITQFKTGGLAILPQSQAQTGLLPNRSFALWPYTDLACPSLTLGSEFVLLRAEVPSPFKIGFPNPRGWLAYWWGGVLFVKRADYDPQSLYSDFGCSSECYCNQQFLELETKAPLSRIEPGGSVTHTETWELFPGIARPDNERAVRELVQAIGLE